ncbi:MAG: ATP-binding protein [Agathobacter sp.]|nr:ATP-binding protein [uncultured Agathobacter sp.]MCI7114338.1 ATP-binding protein [Lachnobacterium sp.]MDY6156193.1 ATP-binding protein [Agathobacter sp.]
MEKRDLFEQIINSAIEIFLSYDDDKRILMMNESARKELMYTDNDIGTSVSRLFQNEDMSEITYDGIIRQMMIYRSNQTCFRAQVKAIKTDSQISPYVLMIRNISDQYALEKAAEIARKETEATAKVKTEFVANVTHELRTPVNGILGNTNILLENETDPKKIGLLNTISKSCGAMNELINGILDFSKLDAGKFTLENRKFNFRNMIDYVKSTHMPKITEKGLKFFVTISPDIPEFVIGDELRISQILNNLLSNACKFTNVGKISLEALMTAQEKNRIELFFIVLDTGIGIAKSDEDKLFKSFSQVDASVSRKYGGTGLGLNISKQLVDLMGGHITIDSELNKGTMFSFSIWVETPEEETAEVKLPVDNNYAKNIHEALGADDEIEKAYIYGSEENRKELDEHMSKLILCLEMENWEKAENFSNSIKQLTIQAPKDIKVAALRMKMAVQKADYDRSVDEYNTLKELCEL